MSPGNSFISATFYGEWFAAVAVNASLFIEGKL